MGLLTKEQILSAELPTLIVEGVFGGQVKIQALSAHDKDQISLAIYNEQQQTGLASNYKARFISASIVDENNKKLFGAEDVEKLGQQSAIEVEKIYDAVEKLNFLNGKDQDELKKN